MRRGHWIGLAGLAAVAVAAVLVASSSAGGGGKGRYLFYGGVHVIDQNGFSRVYVENLGTEQTTMKVIFTVSGVTDVDQLAVGPGGQSNVVGSICGAAACPTQVKIRSRTPLIAPSLRYQDGDGVLQERPAGDFVVVRDGRRVW